VAAVKPDLERLLVITLDLACARAVIALAEVRPAIDRSVGETITCGSCVIPPRGSSSKKGQPVVPIDLLIQPQIRVVTLDRIRGKNRYPKTLGLAA